MSDTNTNEATMEIVPADEFSWGVSAPFLQLPKFITKDPELKPAHWILYATLLDYARLGERTGMGSFPSRRQLAEDCACHIDSINEWLKKLNERGWVSWQRRQNASNLYRIHGPDMADPERGAFKRSEIPTSGKRNLPVPVDGNSVTSNNQVTKNVNPPLSPQGNRDQAPTSAPVDGRVHSPENPQAQRPAEQTTRDRVSNPVNGIAREDAHPYWQGPKRREKFDFFHSNYPKDEPLFESMIAWRLALPEKDVDDDDFVNRAWHGLQWWINKWQAEETEPRYIPAFKRWLERKQWEQAVINPRLLAGGRS